MAALSVLLLMIGSLSTVLSDAGPQGPIVPGVRVVQDVFSTELVEALIKEGLYHKELTVKAGKLQYNKMPTAFLPISAETPIKPRFATEAAIAILKEIDFPGTLFADTGIVGAEWWYQVRDNTEAIGFHYDKDEGLASTQMQMSMPSMSTVTYLTDTGSPTFLLNQTTVDGNANHPVVPEDAYLIFPRRNKHMQFPGNLMHGVSKLANRNSKLDRSRQRVTFLVNWWSRVPNPPNCAELKAEEVAQFNELTKTVDFGVGKQEERAVVDRAVDAELSKQETVVLPPEEKLLVYIPNKDQFTEEALDSHLLWSGDSEALGGFGELDLENDNQMSLIFHTRLVKAFIFYNGKLKQPLRLRAMKALKPFLGEIAPFFADSTKTENAMEVLGVTSKNLPTLALHDTHNDKIRVFDGKLTTKNLQRVVKEFLSKRPESAEQQRDEL